MSIQKNYAVTVDLSQDGQGISIASTSVSSQQIVATGFLTGPTGPQGPAGPDAPVQSVNGMIGDVVISKNDVGLGNVDDTSDINKPVSTAQQTALDLKANDSAVLHLTGAETITGNKTVSNASGDSFTLNGTGSGNALLRFKDDGVETGAIFTLNGSTDLSVRAQATLNLVAANAVASKTVAWTGSTFTIPTAAKLVAPGFQMTTTPTNGYVLTSDASGNASWQVAPGAGGTGITRTITSISSTTSAGATASVDYVYICTSTFTLTLPTAVGNTNRYTIKNSGVGTITIATTSSQTIDGSTTMLISPNSSRELVSNNTNWVNI